MGIRVKYQGFHSRYEFGGGLQGIHAYAAMFLATLMSMSADCTSQLYPKNLLPVFFSPFFLRSWFAHTCNTIAQGTTKIRIGN